jgi:hypothetical protein
MYTIPLQHIAKIYQLIIRLFIGLLRAFIVW